MKLLALLSLLALMLQEAGTASLPKTEREREGDQPRGEGDSYAVLHLGDYVLSLDNYDQVIDLSNYDELTDYRDQLPKTTAYLYARFNRISHIRAGDFKGLTKLKRIDLSSNFISSIDDDALLLLPALQDLILPENKLAALPVLPTGIEVLDIRLNQLRSSGIQPEAFRALEKLQFLYLADNLLDSIPRSLPLSLRSLHLQNNMIETMQRDTFCDAEEHKHTRRQLEDIRLDGNPINLSLFPSAYFCLPRLPTGRFT
ncbi:Opticin, partial [Eschrichtius robustus]|nr:Opticin [Eschrichtius robustus]